MGQKTGLTVENATIEESVMIEEEKDTGTLDGDDDTAGHRDAHAVLHMRCNARDSLYLRRTKHLRRSRMEEKEKAQNRLWKNKSPTLVTQEGWLQRAIQSL